MFPVETDPLDIREIIAGRVRDIIAMRFRATVEYDAAASADDRTLEAFGAGVYDVHHLEGTIEVQLNLHFDSLQKAELSPASTVGDVVSAVFKSINERGRRT